MVMTREKIVKQFAATHGMSTIQVDEMIDTVVEMLGLRQKVVYRLYRYEYGGDDTTLGVFTSRDLAEEAKAQDEKECDGCYGRYIARYEVQGKAEAEPRFDSPCFADDEVVECIGAACIQGCCWHDCIYGARSDLLEAYQKGTA